MAKTGSSEMAEAGMGWPLRSPQRQLLQGASATTPAVSELSLGTHLFCCCNPDRSTQRVTDPQASHTMTSKKVSYYSPDSKPVTYILLQTAPEAPKSATKSAKASKTNKPNGSFLKTHDSSKNLAKQSPRSVVGSYTSEPKNFYCLDLCPLAAGKFLAPELQSHFTIPEATETYIPEDSTAGLQLINQVYGSRKNLPSVMCPTTKLHSAVTMKPPPEVTIKPSSSLTTKPPSIVTTKLPSTVTMKLPPDMTMKPPSEVTREPPSEVTKKPPSAVTTKPPSAVNTKLPSTVTVKLPPDMTMKPPSEVTTKPPSEVTKKPPSAVTTKPPSAVNTKPKVRRQPKNQKKQDKEKDCTSIDLVPIKPRHLIRGTPRHFPIPVATEVRTPKNPCSPLTCYTVCKDPPARKSEGSKSDSIFLEKNL